MRISDWSSDVCSSDLRLIPIRVIAVIRRLERVARTAGVEIVFGERVSCALGYGCRPDPGIHDAHQLEVGLVMYQTAAQLQIAQRASEQNGRVSGRERVWQ